MQILESEHAEIIEVLTDEKPLYRADPRFSKEIVEKAQFICHEAAQRPEFWEGGFNMDAGLEAVMVFLHEQYPWLTREAMYIVRHNCMMAMK